MKSDLNHVIKVPVITEEASIQTASRNQYTFKVDPRANKNQIRDAVEAVFNVRVTSVNTMNYQGKQRRRGRIVGRRPNWKKAVVTLRAGDKIEFF